MLRLGSTRLSGLEGLQYAIEQTFGARVAGQHRDSNSGAEGALWRCRGGWAHHRPVLGSNP